MQKPLLIYGFGRLGRHLARYFELAGIPHLIARHSMPSETLRALAVQSERVLLCVPDRCIEQAAETIRLLNPDIIAIHFSGSRFVAGVIQAHPLAAFSERKMGLEEYREIPFMLSSDMSLNEVLPGLTNPYFHLKPEQINLYHCICVLLGNGTTVLWETGLSKLAKGLDIPRGVFAKYLGCITRNLQWGLENSNSVLTGPWVRGDEDVARKHQLELPEEYQNLYGALKKLAQSRSLQRRIREINP